MFTRLLWSLITAALISNLFISTITVVGQTQDSPSNQQQQAKKAESAAQTSPGRNLKPLNVDEDPALIGKRKLNGGLISKMSMSVEKEVALGRQLAAEVDRQAKFVDDPMITEYVNRVAQNLVLHSDAKIPFTVKVIDSDEVNAFALPGGFFYVNKGLILIADNEAELAGVMAHEISHVIARHAVENQTKANLMQYGTLTGIILLGGIPGMVLQNTAGIGMMTAFMKFSRSAEAEADKLGTEYLYAAGYDPTAMATMFEKLEAKNKKKPGTIAKIFADHPAPADRRAASLALAARFPEHEEYIINTSEFNRVKSRLLRLSNAKASSAGAIQGAGDGTPGRPTLKRRQPTPDDSTQPEGTEQKPSDAKPNEPPKLKRNPSDTSIPTDQSSKPKPSEKP
ncbi:MAG TPA: M48 family metalloprotease [Pyrinomonadaceae bacterium]|nr:M48 family metalloprotease [Pyrinomonadaceae bacterium]